MIICQNCGAQLQEDTRFCTNCGTAVALTQPAPQPVSEAPVQQPSQPAPQPAPQPAYSAPGQQTQPFYSAPVQQPVYSAPKSASFNAKPEVPASAKVKGFIGMGLGIEGFCTALISLIYAFIAMADYYYAAENAGFSIGCGFVSLASGIAGLVLSTAARNAGFENGATGVGKVFSILTIVFSAVSFFFALISLA